MKGRSHMDKTSSPVFRTAINGFNRADVNSYIAALAADTASKLSELEEKIKKLESELEAANAKADEQAAKANDTAIASLTKELEGANAIIEAQKAEIAEKDKKLADKLTEASASAERVAELEEKLLEYSTMSERMGDIFLGATTEADRIRSEAQAEADRLVTDTKTRCDKYADAVEKSLLEYAVSQKAVISDLFDATHKSITGVLDVYDKKARGLIREARASLNTSLPKLNDTKK